MLALFQHNSHPLGQIQCIAHDCSFRLALVSHILAMPHELFTIGQNPNTAFFMYADPILYINIQKQTIVIQKENERKQKTEGRNKIDKIKQRNGMEWKTISRVSFF